MSIFGLFMPPIFKYCLLLFLVVSASSIDAQTTLPEKEVRFVASINETLNLSTSQSYRVDSIFLQSHRELCSLQAEIDSLERADIPENLLNLKISVLNQKKKDIRTYREFDLMEVFSAQQKETYNTAIKPAKPQVLHFGIHDRAKCRVCTK